MDIKLIFSKIMTGIKICHENEIFNGDLKLENNIVID